jgi:hypothetical protein
MTQGLIANMLGARREGVTEGALKLPRQPGGPAMYVGRQLPSRIERTLPPWRACRIT